MSNAPSEEHFAVRNTGTGKTVGMYTAKRAGELADEWNELASRANGHRPYEVIDFLECVNHIKIKCVFSRDLKLDD